MLPNLSTLALSPGNVLVRCPECASHFRKTSPTGCPNCGKRKREEEEKEKECECKKECACDDDAVPDPYDDNMSEQWRNAYWYARGVSGGRLGMNSPEDWQIEAAKRKLAELDEGPPPIVVPEPNDPNMDEQWKNAYLKARGISYGSLSAGDEGEDNPEPWQIEAARRKLAPQDRGPPQPEEADDPYQPPFKSGCTDDDCAQMFSHGCTEEDCKPVYQSCDCDPKDGGEEEEDESEGEGDDVGDWRDDANFDYYRAVGRPPYTP